MPPLLALAAHLFALAVHRATAVDDLAADIAGQVAGEEEGYIGHIFGGSSAPKRNLLDPRVTDVCWQSVRHVRNDESGRDAIGPDAAGAHFLGDRLGQPDHTCLGS